MLINNLVTQSNKLIEAKHTQSLTLREQKIILTFVSMIQPSDSDFKIYSLSITEFYKLLNLKGREHYTHIKKIMKKLMERTIDIPREDGGYLLTHWVSHVEYKTGQGVIELSFDPKLKPYLLQLKRTFTSYKLSNILTLNSYYTIRLYELLKKWEKVGKWDTTVEHFKSLLGITQKSYNVYGNLKNRVINPSIQELNDKTDLQITFKETKKGRQINNLTFEIKQIKNLNKQDNNNNSELLKKENNLLTQMNNLSQNYNIDLQLYKKLYAISKKIFDPAKIEEEILGLIKYTNIQANNNPIGFLLHILKNKEKLYENGENPSILENELKTNSTEVIPEWFRNREHEKEVTMTKEDKKKLEELDRELAKFS